MADKYKVGDHIIYTARSGIRNSEFEAIIVKGPTEMPNGRVVYYVERAKLHPNSQRKSFSIDESQIIRLISLGTESLSDFGAKIQEQSNELKKISFVTKVNDTITIKFGSKGKRTYFLSKEPNANPKEGNLSILTPLGMVLLDKKIGDSFEFRNEEVTILNIEREDLPETPETPVESSQKIKSIQEIDLGEKHHLITSPVNQNIYVNAGPGTGKSFSLVHRVAYLIENHRLSPSQILVLSFSREAVAEVRSRLQSFAIRNVEYVRPVTIDSFAASILREFDPTFKIGNETYDAAIKRATEILQPKRLEDYAHIFIDECQDIVGCRSEFIEKIIELKPDATGLTILGDIRQAIYGWTLQDQDSKVKSREMITRVEKLLGSLERIEFNKNFRTNEKFILDVELVLRNLIDIAEEDPNISTSDLTEKIQTVVDQLPSEKVDGVGKYNIEGSVLSPQDNLRKILLVRDNGQLIAEKEITDSLDFDVQILGKNRKGLMPSWLAKFLAKHTKYGHAHRDVDFLEDFCKFTSLDGWEPIEAWEFLKEIEADKSSEDIVDLDNLKLRMKYVKDVPLSKAEKKKIDKANLTVSTYHQAKGLEFDHVNMLKPDFAFCSDRENLIEEIKVVYVGATRAKKVLKNLSQDGVRKLNKRETDIGDGHLIERWWRKRGGVLEVNVDTEGDIEKASFISNFNEIKSYEIQYRLEDLIKPGSIVDIVLGRDPSDRFDMYFLVFDGKKIGYMSRRFYVSVKDISYAAHVRLPNLFRARVGKVYTEYLIDAYRTPNIDEHYSSEIEAWLALKLTGLARAC